MACLWKAGRGIFCQWLAFGMDCPGCLGSYRKKGEIFCVRERRESIRSGVSSSGSAFENISKSKIKNLEKSSILFSMRSFLKEKMEKHVEDL